MNTFSRNFLSGQQLVADFHTERTSLLTLPIAGNESLYQQHQADGDALIAQQREASRRRRHNGDNYLH